MSNANSIIAPKTKFFFPLKYLFIGPKELPQEINLRLRKEIREMMENYPEVTPESVKNTLSDSGSSIRDLKTSKALLVSIIDTAKFCGI